MKKYAFLSALTLWVTLCVAHSSIISPVLTLGRGGVNSGVPATPAIPNLIAGVNAPMGQTPAMPSVSTEVPRCLDATWGAGCNVATQKCIAPTIGTPYQPCQPPQMLFPTGGTSNGTTGQIFYTSYASWTYPVGEAILIGNTGATHQATQANWNTPRSEVTAFASSGSGCTGGTFPVTLTINDSAAANPYATTGINSTVYVGGVTGSITGVYQSFGWTAGNPNGQYTVVAVGGSAGAWTLTYCTAIQVTGTLTNNSDGYSGVVTSPYIATASTCNIGGNPTACSVTFLNPHTCASSCVSSNTQFVAGQFDDLILNHHFGEQVPLSEQNSVVEPCVIASHISGTLTNPAFSVYAELDGGLFAQTQPITDPRGTGVSGLSIPPKKVNCAQFTASSVPDALHEISWIGCPIVGYCARLQSTLAIDAASGASTFFKANNHALQGGTILGVVASPDAQFPVFDWTQSTLRNIGGVAGAINVTSMSTATGSVTYNFTALTLVGQFKAGSTIGISGVVTGNSCTVAPGSTSNGSVLRINLNGTCNFPTNSTVNIAGIVVSGGNSYAWNGTIATVSSGGVCAAGACTIQVPSLSTATYSSGGTVTANLNGPCVISSSTTSSITCPTNADASTTRVSGGQINSTANLFCAPGGNGDDPPPYDPAGSTEVQQFFPDSLQLIPYVYFPLSCGNTAGQTGCFGSACGRLPTQQETLWVTRFQAGIDEREVANSNTPRLETGSLFIWTNAGATIKRKNVWVDSWNPSAVKTGCYTSATPCADISHALYALQATSATFVGATGNQVLANLTGTKGTCLVFKNATNVTGAIPLYDGEPVEFVGFDANAGAKLGQFGQYWVVGAGATETGDANGVALAAIPGGPCINDTATGIFGGNTNVSGLAWLLNDVGFDNIYLACNASLTCSSTHPETYDWKVLTVASAPAPIYARSSYLNVGPDTTNGVTHDKVSILNGIGAFFVNSIYAAQGGRIHKTADTIDTELSLTPAVALGPTLPIITAVTGGSLATCPAPNAAHQCVTLTFAAHKNPATLANDGAKFQAPTATNPLGQAIVVSGVVSTDSPSSSWNCGSSIASPCGGAVTTSAVVGSTTTSVTFINDAPGVSTYVSGGKIVPTDLVVEFAPGTLTTTTCATDGVANDTHTSLTCLGANSTAAALPQWVGTNGTSFPLSLNGSSTPVQGATQVSRNSNCVQGTTTGGQQSIQAVIPTTGSNNDVMVLYYTLALTTSFNAFNQCDALYFANSVFAPVGTITDMWYDSDTVSGPGPYANYSNTAQAPGTNGGYYVTNEARNSTFVAFSGASYAWGDLSQNAITDCINATFTVISVKCANNGQSVLPFSLGGSLYADGTQWMPILGSLDASGANVQCAGVDCISASSVTIKVPQGSIPYFTSITAWGSGAMCNMPTTVPSPTTGVFNVSPATGTVGTPILTYINNDSNPSYITVGAGTLTTCNISSHPAFFLNNGSHIDFDFNTFGPSLLPGSGIRGGWQTYNNTIQENVVGKTIGTMQGWSYQGGRMFNFALEDMFMELSNFPVPGFLGFFGIAQGEVRNPYNIIVRNTVIGSHVQGLVAGFAALWQDEYFINDSGGALQIAFPSSGLPSWNYTAFWDATALTFQPAAGETAIGGMTTSWAVWPTGTRGVNATTGLPNAASAPYYNSLLAAPWYGVLTDTGLGTE